MDLITGQNTSWEHAPQIEYCKEDSHSIQSLASFLSKILEQACLGSSPLLAMVAGAKSQVCLLPAGELGPSSVALAHMHFIVLKLCNSAVLIYEGCISSSDPCWYRTHYFPFMCLCQRATGNQLLETDLKKKKTLLLLWYYFKSQYLPAVSTRKAMGTVCRLTSSQVWKKKN